MRQAMVDKRTNLLLQIVYIDMENFTTGRVYIDRRCPSQNKIKGNLKNRFLIASSIFIVYKIRKPREKKCEANNGVWRHCWQLLIFLVLIYSFTTFVSLLLPADWKESVTAETVVTDNNFALKGHTHTNKLDDKNPRPFIKSLFFPPYVPAVYKNIYSLHVTIES